jgi:hypothetical protein
MKEPEERRVPGDLEEVAARLSASRAQADPLQLDHIKRTVIARNSRQRQGGFAFMKSRFATVFTLVALLGGTGGAIAIGSSGSSGGPEGGAANAQYCNAKDHKCPPPPKHNCGRHGKQLCPSKPKHCYYWVGNHRHKYECSAGEKANTGFRRPSSKKGVRGVSSTRRAPSFTG